MKQGIEEIEPIRLETIISSTPQNVYRAITSQTDLRKWWAARVILARNVVAQYEGQEMEMRLLQSEKYHLVRYSWKSMDNPDDENTVISFEIEDMGVSRGGRTGEGIQLTIIHDGWNKNDLKEKQEKIWRMALPGLKNLLENKKVTPWWKQEKSVSLFRPIKLQGIKQFVDKIDRDPRGNGEKKHCGRVIGKLCQTLDGQGSWFIKENGNEIELRFNSIKVFGALKNGNMVFNWREIEKMVGSLFKDFSQRLVLEQEIDLHIGKVQEKIPASLFHPDLLGQWFIDVIQYCRENS